MSLSSHAKEICVLTCAEGIRVSEQVTTEETTGAGFRTVIQVKTQQYTVKDDDDIGSSFFVYRYGTLLKFLQS